MEQNPLSMIASQRVAWFAFKLNERGHSWHEAYRLADRFYATLAASKAERMKRWPDSHHSQPDER